MQSKLRNEEDQLTNECATLMSVGTKRLHGCDTRQVNVLDTGVKYALPVVCDQRSSHDGTVELIDEVSYVTDRPAPACCRQLPVVGQRHGAGQLIGHPERPTGRTKKIRR